MIWISFACLVVGVLMLWIGGLLSWKHNYKAHNEAALAAFEGKRIIETTANSAQAVFANAKTRWWYVGGLGLSAIGIFLLVSSTN